MCERTFLWIFYIMILVPNNPIIATTLYPCKSSEYHDVEENNPVTFYCDQYSGSVTWRYRPPLFNTFTDISTCNTTTCKTLTSATNFRTTYISAGNSSLTSTLTSGSLTRAGGEYGCDNARCKIHIIEPAIVSKPTNAVTRIDNDYYLQCNTNITTVYSSRGQYSCVWQVGTQTLNGTLNLQPTPSDTSNTSNRTGSCDVTLLLPVNTGVYTCNVTVNPGDTHHSSDSISFMRPSNPEISCPTCPVRENGTVTCTCTTDNFGQPVGRLVWYARTNGVLDREIVRGNVMVNSLTLTWPVTRSDHNVTMFRCVNEWIYNVNSLTNFTVIVKGDATCAETPKEDAPIGIIIACSIGGVAAVVCVVVVVVCVMKRQKKGGANERHRTKSLEPSVQLNPGRSDVSMIARSAGESKDNPSFGAYESLQSADVGQTSVYSEMTLGSGPVYGNSAT